MTNIEFLRSEVNGVEFFTLVATGESGISESGLARLTGIPQRTLTRWLSDLSQNKAVKGLDFMQGKALHLSHSVKKRGGKAKIVKAEYAFEILEFAAFERSSKIARQTVKACGNIGLTSYIQGVTGWLPNQFQSSPAARQKLSHILDAPTLWVKLYDREFCTKVYWEIWVKAPSFKTALILALAT